MAACSVCGIPLRPSRSDEPTCLSPSCRHLHRLRAPRAVPRRCRYCAHPATPGEETCERDRKAFQVEAVARESRRREEIERTTREVEHDLRAAHGPAVPEPLLHARLPANERTVVPLSEERRAAFAVHLSAALDRALDDPDRPVPVAPDSPPAQEAMIRAACTACRGSCCTYGGDRAYLYPDHFRRLLQEAPGKTREEILSEYRSRLPDRVYFDSCVYHTEAGCALPRELRSNVCNTFLCGGLSEMLDAQPREGPPVPVLAICLRRSASHVVRTALFDGDGRPLL